MEQRRHGTKEIRVSIATPGAQAREMPGGVMFNAGFHDQIRLRNTELEVIK